MTKVMQTAPLVCAKFVKNNEALALLEFALSLPIVLILGLYAVETSNLALTNLRASQIALQLADNASRVGNTVSSTEQLREGDINDVLYGAKLQGSSIDVTGRGRLTISSLEEHNGVQVIHWQRCIGVSSGSGYDSSYGTTTTTAGTDTSPANAGTPSPLGMGDPGSEVIAPPNSGVMFVELNYDYRPIVTTSWLPNGSTKLHYIASFIVRNNRDFSQIYNPTTTPTTSRSSCDKHLK